MTHKTTRWLLCLVLVLAMVASVALAACNEKATATFAGGTDATGEAPSAQSGAIGDSITLPQNTFTREGYTFAGWSDGSATYQAGDSYELTADVTFTAQWTQNVTKITLIFELGDHAAEGEKAPETKSYNAGEEITLPDAPKAADGWEFAGWGESKLAAGSKYTVPSISTKFIAQWTEKTTPPTPTEPLLTSAFDGTLYDESGHYITFGSSAIQEGKYSFDFASFSGEESATGLYTISKDGIEFFSGESKIGTGSFDGRTLSVSITAAGKEWELSGEMYCISISGLQAETEHYLNVGAPVISALGNYWDGSQTVTFNGKAFDFETEGEGYYGGGEYTKMPAQDCTAQFATAGATEYTLSFDLGDHAAQNATLPQSEKLAAGETTTLPQAPAAEEGWEFDCWYDGYDPYEAGAEYPMPFEDTVMTAQWKQSEPTEKKYTLTLEVGDHAILTGPVYMTMEFRAGAQCVLPQGPLPTDEKVWEFAGWGEDKLQPGDLFTMPAEDTTLVAQWRDKTVTLYTLSFDLGYHAVSTAVAPESQQLAKGATYTLPQAPAAEEGWAFDGWFDGETKYEASAAFTMPAHSVTLTAQWKLTRDQFVISDFYGIWAFDEPFTAGDMGTYDALQIGEEGIECKEVGYDFDGYYEEVTTSVVDGKLVATWGNSYAAYSITFASDSEATFAFENFFGKSEAPIHRASFITVTFDLGEYSEGDAPEQQSILPGSQVDQPATPSWEKHRFLGWFADGSDEPVDFDSATFDTDTTLTAHWEEIITVTVTFDPNGQGVQGMPQAQTLDYGKKATAPASQPTRAGYVFQGWGTLATSKVYFDFANTEIKDDITLYAIWKKQITITFSVNGDTTLVPAVTVLEGEPVDLPTGPFTKEGWDFVGWKVSTSENLLTSKTLTRTTDTTVVAVFGKTYTVAEKAYYYEKAILRDDDIIDFYYEGDEFDNSYSFTYSDSTKLYAIYLYDAEVEFKIEGEEIIFSDTFNGTFTAHDDAATLTFDGFGNATLTVKDGQPVTGTYTVGSLDSYTPSFTITFDSDVSTLDGVMESDYWGYTLTFVGVEGFLKYQSETYIFGEPKVEVTVQIGEDTQTVEVTYGEYFEYPESIEDLDDKTFRYWMKDGAKFDETSEPITEPITLTAKFQVVVTFFAYGDEEDFEKWIWDDDDTGSVTFEFPSGDFSYGEFTFLGWVNENTDEDPTVHNGGESLTVNKSTHYAPKYQGPELRITEPFNGMVPLNPHGGSLEGSIMFFDDGTGAVEVSDTENYDDDFYAEFTYTIDSVTGKITITFTEDYPDPIANANIVGSTVTANVQKDAFESSWSFEGTLYQLTIKNYLKDSPEKTYVAWYAAGTEIWQFFFMGDSDDGAQHPTSYKINGTEEKTYEEMSDLDTYPLEEDTTIEFVWGGVTPPQTEAPFTTEPFNAVLTMQQESVSGFVSLSSDGEVPSYVQFSENGDIFSYTIAADGTITVSGLTPEEYGISFVSGSLHGRTLTLTFSYKYFSSTTEYTFTGELIKVSYTNYNNKGENYVTYFAAGTTNLTTSDESYTHQPIEYRIGGETVSASDAETYQLTEDIEVECIWQESGPTTSYTITYLPGDHATVKQDATTTDTTAESGYKLKGWANFFEPEDEYYFTGWQDEEGNDYTNTQTITLTKSITLTAQWGKKIRVTIVGMEASGVEYSLNTYPFDEATHSVLLTASQAEKFVIPSAKSTFPPTDYISRSGFTPKWTCSCHPGETLTPGTTHAITADATLTISWELEQSSGDWTKYYGTYTTEEAFTILDDYVKVVIGDNEITFYQANEETRTATDIQYNAENITAKLGMYDITITFDGDTMTVSWSFSINSGSSTLTKSE